jgi:hypothetical protein
MDIIDRIKNIDTNNKYNLCKLYNELKDNYNKDYLDYLFYSLKKYEYKETEETEQIETREKRQDNEYRESIKKKFNYCCAVTNKPIYVCQVAHIHPYKLCNPEEKYDDSNGLLLSAELHLLFDNFKFIINPDTHIMTFSEDILQYESMSYYRQYHNAKINLSEKNIEYLKKKYNIS